MKKVSKILFLAFFIFIVWGSLDAVQANTINEISMDIYLDKYGDAHVTEIWNCKTDQGTEVYHPYYNLGESKILDLSVKERDNVYTTLSSWNASGSLSSKANKCGINKIDKGVELCWGMGSYGSHKYIVTYTITNFVSELTDSQMIYWTLIPKEFSNVIGRAYIKIHSDFKIASTVDVWGYGNYGGTAYVYDGYIEMESKGSLAKNEYMTILVKFPKETFECKNVLDYKFDHYFQMAEKGAKKYNKNFEEILGAIISIISTFFFPCLIILGTLYASKTRNLQVDKEVKKQIKNAEYYRDIPANKDLFKAYYVAYNYGMINKKENILGALILKWIKDSEIKIETRNNGKKVFNKDENVLIMKPLEETGIVDPRERDMYNMIYISSKDGILEDKEFEKWCRSHYEKVLNWFDKAISTEEVNLISNNYIIKEKKGFSTKKIAQYSLNQIAIELSGLKKFLLDYSLINEREALEVKVFEEYLIYAELLGIADKVQKQFKELYPNLIEQSSYGSYNNIYIINTSVNKGIGTARNQRASEYSSGGGGFSSGGGGRRVIWWWPEAAEDSVKSFIILK